MTCYKNRAILIYSSKLIKIKNIYFEEISNILVENLNKIHQITDFLFFTKKIKKNLKKVLTLILNDSIIGKFQREKEQSTLKNK